MSDKLIGITMGDAAGVGPELCLDVLQNREVAECCIPVVFGGAAMLRRIATLTGKKYSATVVDVAAWDGAVADRRGFIVDCDGLATDDVVCGEIQSTCGAAAYAYIKKAVDAARKGHLSGVVTAPIHKEALRLAGVPYPGHTEMLADLTNTKDFCMMMASDEINVCLVTTHRAVSNVSDEISEKRILKVIELADHAMQSSGLMHPHLTVCGLNPHAGEGGLFGDEELLIINPAVEKAREMGYDIEGPLPPDTAFVPSVRKRTAAYIVMYHDQGLIPFKMLAFDKGVNVTLGLPIIRTSVDHGTAFDIAWKGVASSESMVQAVKKAVALSG